MKNLKEYINETNIEKYKEISEKEARELHKRWNRQICLLSSDYDINNETERQCMGFIEGNEDFDKQLKVFKKYECHGNIYTKFYIEEDK